MSEEQYSSNPAPPRRLPSRQSKSQSSYGASSRRIPHSQRVPFQYVPPREMSDPLEGERRARESTRRPVERWPERRRRSAERLLRAWQSVAPSLGTPSFAVHADRFVEEIEQEIPVFRQVPYEEVYSGVLQLIRNILTGPNFARLERPQLGEVVMSVLNLLTVPSPLSLHTYDRALDILLERGVIP